jgi:hypothetical protein
VYLPHITHSTIGVLDLVTQKANIVDFVAQHQSSSIVASSISFSQKTTLNCAYSEVLLSRDSPFLHPFLHGNSCHEGGPIAFSALGLISVCHLMWICQWVYNKLAKCIFHASSNPTQSWVMNMCTTLHC